MPGARGERYGRHFRARPGRGRGRGGAQIWAGRGGPVQSLHRSLPVIDGLRGCGTDTMSEADGLRQRRPLRPQVVTDDGQAPEAKDGR